MSVGGTTKEMALTRDVLDHHLKCFGEGDLRGILSDYAPGAVLFTPDGPLRGTDAIRPLFQAMIAEFGKPGAEFSMQQYLSRATMLIFCGPQRLPTTCTR
jgi:ketosteroid isomerase-like protein